jgi:hypothetical protein
MPMRLNPFLAVVFPIVQLVKRHSVLEDIASLLEANLVLLPVCFRLLGVPFELDGDTTTYP